MDPLVSVVTATYNRSSVLELALQTLLHQTFVNWELWVVGDACTDDTAAVVEALGDPRARFVNLPQNCGEQSGPNNEGVRRAHGRYIAFLNHDDFWFPDHLEKAVEQLETTGADLVFGMGARIDPCGGVTLASASPTGRWEPFVSVPASCWVLRRQAFEVVGEWRAARACWTTPSQEWLFRAGRAGLRMELLPEMTVVILESGRRPGSYRSGDATEHLHIHDRMKEPEAFRTELLTRAALASTGEALLPRGVGHHVRRASKDLVRRLCLATGVSQQDVLAFASYRRRGGLIEHARRVRGLPPQ
ncbi:MAG: glycosyltransferase [Actinomycetota bacterium]|nr:glycosyltransferase [Actinomycetota bacterium]